MATWMKVQIVSAISAIHAFVWGGASMVAQQQRWGLTDDRAVAALRFLSVLVCCLIGYWTGVLLTFVFRTTMNEAGARNVSSAASPHDGTMDSDSQMRHILQGRFVSYLTLVLIVVAAVISVF